jgi:LPXTG-site transpeptidase (sortase) family protein
VDAGKPTASATEGFTTTTSSPSAVEATPERQPAALQPSQAYTPTRIVVSSVGVDAPVIPIAMVTAGEDGSEAKWEVPEPDVAGWHETSAPLGMSGNTVINGHNWPQEAVFRDLHKIEPGEAIAVYADGLGFAYEVTEVVLLPEQGQSWEVQLANTHYIDPTEDDRLTIITCHPYGSVRYRLVVVALRTELAQPDGL